MTSLHTVLGFLVTVTKHLTETTDLFGLMVSEPSVLPGEEGMMENMAAMKESKAGAGTNYRTDLPPSDLPWTPTGDASITPKTSLPAVDQASGT